MAIAIAAQLLGDCRMWFGGRADASCMRNAPDVYEQNNSSILYTENNETSKTALTRTGDRRIARFFFLFQGPEESNGQYGPENPQSDAGRTQTK